MTKKVLSGQLQKWVVDRKSRQPRFYVVEPTKYEPCTHKAIFLSIINHFFNPPDQTAFDSFSKPSVSTPPLAFDLMTFPEAFLPCDDFVGVLKALPQGVETGCIHVGLRPDEGTNHLFSAADVNAIVGKLKAIEHLEKADLKVFETWAKKQDAAWNFNLGCMFAVTKNGKLRTCLHPKMVRSDQENTPVPDTVMKEGSVLSLVNLVPTNKQLMSITVQPLLCSDALFNATETPSQRPFEAVNDPGSSFGRVTVPDHVDVVSLATCTRQTEQREAKGTKYRQWHEKFRETFIRVGKDPEYWRHEHAMFVMSNFNDLSGNTVGGLSGAFVPLGPETKDLHACVETSCFGRLAPDGKENEWSSPARPAGDLENLRSHLAVLRPDIAEPGVAARLLGFSLSHLPRQVTVWSGASKLVNIDLRDVRKDHAGSYVVGVIKP